MRTCDGLGITEVALSGYTPKYNDPAALPHVRAKLNRQIEKSALGAEKTVKQELVADLAKWLERKKTQDAMIIGLENNLKANEEPRKIILGAEPDINEEEVILVLGKR